MEQQITMEMTTSSCIITGLLEKPAKFPSQLFPIPGPLNMMNATNTEPFPDTEETRNLKEIYDSIEAGVGTCYNNIEKLVAASQQAGIKLTPFVGWIIVGGAKPVHHCFAMHENHILDFVVKAEEFAHLREAASTLEEAREALANEYVTRLKAIPNSAKSTFGQASKYALYLAAPCKPEAGRKAFQKLLRSYPKHPCYENIDHRGLNPTQEKIYKKMEPGALAKALR